MPRLKRGKIMRLRHITLTGMVLLLLAFITIAGATDQNTTGNETQDVNVTGTTTETLTATDQNATGNGTQDVNVTGTTTKTLTSTPTEQANDEESANGIFGPGHLLYRLQIAFENMNEVFTYNASEKLGKQVSHARHRINEYRAAIKRNDIEAADIALAEYGAKINDVDDSVSKLSNKDTGFINAQQMILKHQLILENLSISHPNSTGLQKAYNNSKNLQTKFDSNSGKESDINNAMENRGIPKAEKTEVSIKDSKAEKGNKRSE